MSSIVAFITSFCVGCIVLGILLILCPSGNMANSVKYIIGLCFVCIVVAGVTTVQSPNFSFFEKNGDEEVLTEQNTAVTAQMIFSEALRQQNVNFRKITVKTNKLHDNSIIIEQVTVYSSDDSSKIMQAIGSDSYEVYVVNE